MIFEEEIYAHYEADNSFHGQDTEAAIPMIHVVKHEQSEESETRAHSNFWIPVISSVAFLCFMIGLCAFLVHINHIRHVEQQSNSEDIVYTIYDQMECQFEYCEDLERFVPRDVHGNILTVLREESQEFDSNYI
ncbi:unnamed protein product [Caenorhabditis sp. 36 PRJEB53466]|nr:unnamed protein product [Caenorhabditis sp. 36 PRJEB53466]